MNRLKNSINNICVKVKEIGSMNIFIYILIFSIFMGSNFLKFSIFGINFNVSRILMLCSTFALFNLIRKEGILKYNNFIVKCCIVFFIIWSVYSIISIYQAKDIMFYITVNFYICVGTINIIFFTRYADINKHINNIFAIIVIAVFINCIYYLWLYFIKNENIGGFYHNSNDLATILMFAIVISVYLLKYSSNKKQMFCYIFVLIVLLFSFINIWSRGCILGIIFAIFIFAIIEAIKYRDRIKNSIFLRVTIIFAIISLIIVVIIFFNKYIGKISFKPVERAEISTDVRVNLIFNGLHFLNMKSNWLTGIGTGNTIYYLKNCSVYPVHSTYSFHNFWLEILVEFGAIVTLGFIIMYLLMCRNLYKNDNKSIINANMILLFFWSAFIIASISSSSMLTREWLWFAFAITISRINVDSDGDIIKKICKKNS